MSVLRQIFTVTALGISTLSQRRGTSIVIVAGVCSVVAVLISMLSVNAGMSRMYSSAGNEDRVIVLSKEGHSEIDSNLPRASVSTLLNAPGIAKSKEGTPLADAQALMIFMPPPDFTGADSLQVRGIGPAGVAIREDFKIESGRMFRTGAQELIIGVGASRRFGMRPGDKVLVPGGSWPIVGTFSNGGEKSESELFADAETLMSAARRGPFGSVILNLERPDAFGALERWVIANPALSVKVARMSDYLLQIEARRMKFFQVMTYVIGGIMALGALFGAVKIMYAAVRARMREIGTLRAMGFSGGSVAASVLLEAMLLALTGAALGALIAWLLFDGRKVFSTGVFSLHVSMPLVLLGLAWAVGIALLGGLFPAIRAGRVPAAQALRAV
jgi:putative ABC transport system permease protein